jgi:hypothetical protein
VATKRSTKKPVAKRSTQRGAPKAAAKSNVTSSKIFETIPGPQRKKARFWMERLDVDRNLWSKAESSMQGKDLGVLLNRARAMPQHLRVMVRDWKDASVVLDAAQAVVIVKGGIQYVRPAKGKRLLPTTVAQAQEVPVVKQTKQIADAVKRIRGDARQLVRERKAALAHTAHKPVMQPVLLARPTPSVDRTSLVDVLANARGNTAIAEAMRKAAQHA